MAGRLCNQAIAYSDEVTSTGSATQLYPKGQVRVEEGTVAAGASTYRYVYFDNGAGNIAAAAGAIAYRGVTAANFWDVTSDVSDVDSAFAAGAFQSVIVDTYYGWIKTKGYQSNLKKSTGTGLGWTKGDALYAGGAATDDGKAYRIKLAATTKVTGAEIRAILERPVGWAAAAVSSTTATGAAYIEFE
jgi:hypothetical protein